MSKPIDQFWSGATGRRNKNRSVGTPLHFHLAIKMITVMNLLVISAKNFTTEKTVRYADNQSDGVPKPAQLCVNISARQYTNTEPHNGR